MKEEATDSGNSPMENLDFDHKLVGDQFIAGMKGIKEMASQPQSAREKIAKIIEDNIYRKHNGNWDGDAADLLVAADEILAAQAAPGEPVAWLVPSDETGFCRIWWRDKERAEAWLAKHPTCTLLPLALATPAAHPQDGRDPATIEACAKVVEKYGLERMTAEKDYPATVAAACIHLIRALSSKGK